MILKLLKLLKAKLTRFKFYKNRKEEDYEKDDQKNVEQMIQ